MVLGTERIVDGALLITALVINRDGTGLQQITFDEGFDGFPMFTNDGKYLIWGSNRHGKTEGETNVFIAEWMDKGSPSD